MTTDGRRSTDGRRLDGYPISSPCEPNGSGELKMGGGEWSGFSLGVMVNDVNEELTEPGLESTTSGLENVLSSPLG